MPLTSRHMGSTAQSYDKFVERRERKERNMVTMLKKKDRKAEEAEAAKKSSKSKVEKAEPKKRERGEPVEPSKRDGDRYGKKWGLKLNETFERLLRENENAKTGHKTDEELMKFLADEFENRENKSILYNMREIRWRYNVGKLTPDSEGNNVPPELQSVRYNSDGTAFVRTSKKTGQTAEERAMSIEKKREVETTRRADEEEARARMKERMDTLETKIAERRAAWEEKNGAFEEEEAAPEKPAKKLKKLGKK